MTLLFYLKPANSMIVGPHQWAPELQWNEGLVKGKAKKKRKKSLHFQRLINDEEEMVLSYLRLLYDLEDDE